MFAFVCAVCTHCKYFLDLDYHRLSLGTIKTKSTQDLANAAYVVAVVGSKLLHIKNAGSVGHTEINILHTLHNHLSVDNAKISDKIPGGIYNI